MCVSVTDIEELRTLEKGRWPSFESATSCFHCTEASVIYLGAFGLGRQKISRK